MAGGILDVSIMSFQTIESAKSADVVGNSRIALILYNPTPNHTKLIATYIAFAICVSTSKWANVRSIENKLVIGVKIAELVVFILKMFKLLPDMYIINAFIATWLPGFVAICIAFCFLFATRAILFLDGAAVGFTLLCSAFCNCDWPIGSAHFERIM